MIGRTGVRHSASRRVADTILTAYPSAGLVTVARLADRAEVSGPTVIRLFTRLGFQGFPEFQEALIEKIQERTASPLAHYGRRENRAHLNALDETLPVLIENLNSSFSSIDRSTFDNAVDLLADGRMRCAATGGRFSGVVNALGDRAIARVSDYESVWAAQGFTEPGIVD